jgi:hypothetical protein
MWVICEIESVCLLVTNSSVNQDGVREFGIMKKLIHPNVVRCFDAKLDEATQEAYMARWGPQENYFPFKCSELFTLM